MPDELQQQQSVLAIRLYGEFRKQLDAAPKGGRMMPYRWWSLPQPLSGLWMVYATQLDEYATDLANIINSLTHHVARLRAWSIVVEPLSADDKLAVAHEFVDDLGTVALGLPYAIKSRFTLAALALCHQANRAKDMEGWVDVLPDKRAFYLNDIDPHCQGWKAFRGFKLKVEPLAGRAFKADTADFRNAYNHGFSSRFLVGITAMMRRIVAKDGSVAYGYGGREPLQLAQIADLLSKERDLCYAAFEKFQALVVEQIEAIANFDASVPDGRPDI
ncbi:integrase [Caulobacter sp. FWC2]|uniref:integrase n=1 Tax=Caulobacter sp. FWC2 TaxID=69664 RepID=UPI000C144A6D|nr:integrase [Caulobacter sp. FWC2]PIB92735.1 integrase [Caulobacter sp. FWC2]